MEATTGGRVVRNKGEQAKTTREGMEAWKNAGEGNERKKDGRKVWKDGRDGGKDGSCGEVTCTGNFEGGT